MDIFVKKMKITTKLTVSSLAFALPIAVLLYFMVAGVNASIRFSTMELYGDAYQRPLEKLLEALPAHQRLLTRMSQGVSGLDTQLADVRRRADQAFAELKEASSLYGEDLQFTDEGLALRKRSHLKVPLMEEKWRRLKAATAPMDEDQASLVQDVRDMITHAGDTSNLILDPDLDSYYMMDITLLALPQTMNRLYAAVGYGEQALAGGGLDEAARRRLSSLADQFEESDLARVEASTGTALNEDRNFLGVSASLQSRVPPALASYAAASREFVALLRKAADSPAGAVSARDLARSGDRALEAAFAYWQVAAQELDVLLETRVDSHKARRLRTLVGLSVSLSLACLLAFLVIRSIGRPLGRMVAAVQAVARGELDTAFDSRTNTREIRILDANLAAMVGKLRDSLAESAARGREAEESQRRTEEALAQAREQEAAVQRLLSDMREVAAGAQDFVRVMAGVCDDLSARVRDALAGAEEQSRRSGEVATATGQMNSTVLEVARNAGDAAEQAHETRERCRQGQDVVAGSVAAIGRVRETTHRAKDGMERLAAQAEGIGRIMGVISDIADQTNLLALNAAIEAARAGDAGRGFAVVADEVRKLAEKTMVATKEVGEAVTSIQQGAREVSRGMDDSSGAVDEATGLAERSREALQSILALAEATSDQIRAIATAAEEQSAASEEISRNLEGVNQVATRTSDSMHAFTRDLDGLVRQSQDLERIVARITA